MNSNGKGCILPYSPMSSSPSSTCVQTLEQRGKNCLNANMLDTTKSIERPVVFVCYQETPM